jgi:hypothetical protein
MNRKSLAQWFGVLSLALFGLLGCYQAGRLGGLGIFRGTLRGEVQRADMRYRSIMIETADREKISFYHTDRTRVSYRGSPYPVGDIEPGDYLEVETRDSDRENPTADVITVVRKGRR